MLSPKSVICAVVALSLLAAPAMAAEFSAGLGAGYYGGPGLAANGAVANFAEGFPLSAALAIGYTRVDPGNPAEAREIFINNATNGTPEEQGWRWDYRFDLGYPILTAPARRLDIFGGVRYSRHTSNFRFVGGNEDFNVTSNQWGWGLGLAGIFQMTSKTDLVLSGGVDYYKEGQLSGHDTTYNADGQDVNAREDYAYNDADAAINQPELQFRMMFGINYRFGR